MRRSIFVFAVVASVLMLACAAAGQNVSETAGAKTAGTETQKSTFDTIKETIMSFVGPFLNSGVLSSFKLSSLLGLFDRALEDIKIFGNYIEELQEQCSKEQKELESIRAWAQAAAAKGTQSGELTKKLNSLTTTEETGQKKIKELKKQKEIVDESKKEADAAIQNFDSKQAMLVQTIVKTLTAETFPNVQQLMGTGMSLVPIVTGMFSSFKNVNKASATAEEAFLTAKQATKSIKQYLKESQEIEKSLQTSDLKNTARRAIVGSNGTIISDASFGFSLMQNSFFLTLLAAFLIADKPVW